MINFTVGKAVLLFVNMAIITAMHPLITNPEAEYDNNNIQFNTNDYHTFFIN